MTTVILLIAWLIALPMLLACGYLLFLTLLSGSPKVPPVSKRKLRFDVIVPAHNEASIISKTIGNLQQIDWPAEQFRILVVADNCTDDTATLASQAGATALIRNDARNRGKGYALQFGFAHSAVSGFADAVVVIDADAEVSANVLEAFSCRIETGAHAVQVHYGILNPDASWRTRLITIAKAAFHIIRSRARERMKVSCGIRGNGWCVTHHLLRQVPYGAFSLTEDVEYGITLGQSGYRVHYADEAHSDAEMVSNEQAARKQRQRWEDGRFQLIAAKTWPLLKQAISQRNIVCLDLAIDLMVLPISYVAANIFVLMIFAGFGALWVQELFVIFWISSVCLAALTLHILRGWQLSGVGLRGLIDLAHAPGFVLWKIWLMLRRRESTEWVRTEREKT